MEVGYPLVARKYSRALLSVCLFICLLVYVCLFVCSLYFKCKRTLACMYSNSLYVQTFN